MVYSTHEALVVIDEGRAGYVVGSPVLLSASDAVIAQGLSWDFFFSGTVTDVIIFFP